MEKKIKTLKPDDFFSQIAASANYLSVDIVKEVYYGMLRVMGRNLRTNGATEMPDFGVFVLHKHKARNSYDLKTGLIVRLPEKNTIKFKPCGKLKEYFYLVN